MSLNMGRRGFLKTSAGLSLTAMGRAYAVEQSIRPNVLFIMTDQQTIGAMSAAGNPYVNTPNMDALAKTGVRFEQSYCTSPVCSPSRSSLVTSRMPHETGVPHNLHQNFDVSLPNMGTIFREAGYRTAWAGKWHLEDSYPKGNAVPGFEYLQPIPRPERDFNGGNVDDKVANAAIAFLNRKDTQPFLLAVSLHNPHDICGLKEQGYPKPGDDKEIPPLPDNFAMDPNEPEFISHQRGRTTYGPENVETAAWSEEQWRYYLHRYYRYVEDVDAQIGRVMEALREQGLEEDTIVLFTSDHGEGTAGHKWVVKLMLYEEPAKVPMIVRWKGVTPQRVDDRHLVSGLDVVPTLCDYAGVACPDSLRGMSLRPLIESPDTPGRDHLVCQLQINPEEEGRMLRTQRYKYVLFSMGERPEMLFDLEADPGEMHNLAAEQPYREVLVAHRQLLQQWMMDVNDDYLERFAVPVA